MAQAQAEQKRPSSWLTVNGLLSSLVIIFTIFTAYASYLATVADAKSSDLELAGQRALSDADLEQLSVNQFLQAEFRSFDNWVLAEAGSEQEGYYFSVLAEETVAAMERNEDGYPFDDAYFDLVYEDATALFDEAEGLFEEADEAGNQAVAYQAVVLTLAVGLAFTAWASLADEGKRRMTRLIFAALSVGLLLVGVVQFLAVG